MELTYENLMRLGKEYVKERTMSYTSFEHLDFFVWLRQREEIEAAEHTHVLEGLPAGHSGSSLTCPHPFCVAEREQAAERKE